MLESLLELHAEPLGDAIHEREIGRHRADVVHGAIVEAGGAQPWDRVVCDSGWSLRQRYGIVEHHQIGWRQVRRAVIGRQF